MRAPEHCPHREPSDTAPGAAWCRLAGELSGLGPRGVSVGTDACRACCRRAVPNAGRINPVIASLVSRAVSQTCDEGGPCGLSREEAHRLLEWSRERLRVAFHDDLPLPSMPPRSYRACVYRGDEMAAPPSADDEGPTFACRHPEIVAGTTTPDGCHRCREWTDRPRRRPRPLERLVPPGASRSGPPVRRWAVGVRTAPRTPPMLDWSLDSLVRAGWPEVRIVADGAVSVASRHAHRTITRRSWPVGSWPNFYLTLIELLMADPDADAYVVAEDDVVYYDRQDLRGYLERVLWPGDRPGVVSLYCPDAYDRPEDGWHQPPGPWKLGSLALVFPAALAKRFVVDPEVLESRWTGRADGLAGPGVIVGAWADRHGIPVYYPCPSLAQHVGDRSTLWAIAAVGDCRRASRFLDDLD